MSPTLLLADDSVTIQRVIELTFADEDIQVIVVGDGKQTIDCIKADPPDIVLADTGMPERDGYEVATFIKQDPALAHIPVVLLTGAFEPVDGDRARQVGCDAVLVKPFEPQVVINRVRELLRGQSTAVVPSPEPVTLARSQDADVDAPTPHAETAAHDPDALFNLPASRSAADVEPASLSASDGSPIASDPLGDYLDRMDEAFDRFEAGDPAASGLGRTPPEELRPVVQDPPSPEVDFASLDGALSVLEGALDKLGADSLDAPADDAPAARADSPSTPDAASPPGGGSVREPVPAGAPSPPVSQGFPESGVAAAPSAPQPSAEVVVEPTSLTETSRSVKVQAPPPESVSASPSPEPEASSPEAVPGLPSPEPAAPAPPPAPVAVSAPQPSPPLPQRSPDVPAAPVDTPPSLADATLTPVAAAVTGCPGRPG